MAIINNLLFLNCIFLTINLSVRASDKVDIPGMFFFLFILHLLFYHNYYRTLKIKFEKLVFERISNLKVIQYCQMQNENYKH